MKMNGKHLVIVFLVGIWMAAGADTVHAQLGLMSAQPPQKPQPNVLSCPGGRFAFGQISDSSKDQFMLDTLSGRLWRISESGEVGLFLNPVPYRSKDGKYFPLPGNGPPEGPRKEPGKK